MATESRKPRPPVKDALATAARGFDFFQAVRVLEWQARRDATDPRMRARGPLGDDTAPGEEPVRFRAARELTFPVAPIASLQERDSAGGPARPPVPEMSVAFMGLTGPSGVLPAHYSDLVMREWRDRNTALADFLDLFNHRLVSLFYRAWCKYRLAPSFERSFPEKSDPVTAIVAALVGLGGNRLRNRLAVSDLSVFYFGGHYARPVPAAAALEAMLSDHFQLPVRVIPFQPRWITLPLAERTVMGERFARLGVDAVAGDAVFNVASAFCIRVGPMPYAAFARFLPGSTGLKELVDLARLYVGPDLDFDIQCVIHREEVPACQLSSDAAAGSLLGWSSWLQHDDRREDADDPVFAQGIA